MEYASYLWGMSYQDVEDRVQRLKGKRLTDLIEEAVAGEWNRAGFQEGITQTLATGTFTLIIVVDEINEELTRIIRYINECSKSSFSLHVLAVRRFQASGIEILVPQLHGLSVKPPGLPKEKRKKWTKEEFFEVLRSNVAQEVVPFVEELYEWAEDTADRVWLGTGVETGSFTFHYLKEGKTISVFSVYTTGRMTLNYGWLSAQVDKQLLEEFHRRLTQIPTLQHIPADFSKWHPLKIADAINSSEALQQFQKAVEWLGSRIRNNLAE